MQITPPFPSLTIRVIALRILFLVLSCMEPTLPASPSLTIPRSDLPNTLVSHMVSGFVSKPFIMIDNKLNREVVAMVKLTNRIDGHKANMADDYQVIKNMYENAEREAILRRWLEKKIADTYVRIEDGWRNCEFMHKGWVKEKASASKE